ncbi:hypothetical protein AB0H18_28465 [Streptomyces sp. NPDC020766]|uniref:hypothetical protein n=1 Tax=Streptomyces sp. NPDC020766 TaxID=3155011 RepID=UPI0033ECF1D3
MDAIAELRYLDAATRLPLAAYDVPDGRRFEARVASRESGERPWFVPRRVL